MWWNGLTRRTPGTIIGNDPDRHAYLDGHDRETQQIVAYHGHVNMQEQEVTIDGRPAPSSANALHT